MSKCTLHLGSNLNDRLENINQAYISIKKEIGQILKISKIYETAPWGNEHQNHFLNSAVLIDTNLNPYQILEKIIEIENSMGRTREVKWGSRIIDIDIIFYDSLILQSALLTIPHPNYTERNFVLKPLSDLSPQLVDPRSKKSILQVAEECLDRSSVALYT